MHSSQPHVAYSELMDIMAQSQLAAGRMIDALRDGDRDRIDAAMRDLDASLGMAAMEVRELYHACALHVARTSPPRPQCRGRITSPSPGVGVIKMDDHRR
jgi:hypothetical protein